MSKAKPEAQSVAVKQESALAKPNEPSRELAERMLAVQENLAVLDSVEIPRIKMTSEGFSIAGEEPIKELEGIIIYSKKTNTYYDRPYNPLAKAEDKFPTCFSLDTVRPDPSSKQIQNATCEGCPKAEFGTNAMKSGKACRNSVQLYMLLSDDALLPLELTVTPTSLKAVKSYFLNLLAAAIPFNAVQTKITAYKDDPKSPYCKLNFSKGKKLDDQTFVNVKWLRGKWLSVMNTQIGDALEPETTKSEEKAPYAEAQSQGSQTAPEGFNPAGF